MRIEIALRGDGIREQFRFVLASHRKFNHASATTAFLWSRVINHFSKTVNDCNTLPDRNVSCLTEDAVKVQPFLVFSVMNDIRQQRGR